MIDISVAPEVGIVMEGSLKDKKLSFQFFVSFFFFLISTISRGFRRQGVFLSAVYLHGQRPSSTSTPKVFHVTEDRNLLWTKHQRVYLTSSRPYGKKSHIYGNESSCKQSQCPLTVITSSERSVWNLVTKTVYFVLTFLSRTAPCKKRRDRLWGR